MTAILALDVGGTHVTAGVVDVAAGRLLPGSYRRHPLVASATAHEIIARIAACASEAATVDRAVLAIAIPGPFDYDAGIGRFSDVGKFDALNGVDVAAALRAELPGSPTRIWFINDAHAFGIGTYLTGPAAGAERLVVVTLGTGVGSAFLCHGIPVTSGPTVPPEGRLDLLPINGRPLEETLSRRAILARYAKRTGSEPTLDVADIAARARAGDATARDTLAAAAQAFGRALAPWLVAFDAQKLVLGGSVTRAGDLLLGPLHRGLDESVAGLSQRLPAITEPSEHAALIGAAWAGWRGRPPPRGAARAGWRASRPAGSAATATGERTP